MATVLALVSPVAFVAIWILTTGLISRIGGWHGVAERYGAPDGFEVEPEQRLRFRSILLRRLPWFPARYRGCVTVSLAPVGLHLAVLVFFRFRHPPLLIPWTAIAGCEEGSAFGFRWTDVAVRDADPAIRIYGGAGAAVAAEWRRLGPAGDARR
jgi:hypothetical protein